MAEHFKHAPFQETVHKALDTVHPSKSHKHTTEFAPWMMDCQSGATQIESGHTKTLHAEACLLLYSAPKGSEGDSKSAPALGQQSESLPKQPKKADPVVDRSAPLTR